jgi:RimJ/RimL family protein N-acetyltransferase
MESITQDESVPRGQIVARLSAHASSEAALGTVSSVFTSHDETWTISGELGTDRLVLRAHLASDLDDLVLFHGDPEVTRYIPWPTRDRPATEAALAVKLAQVTARPGEWLVLAVTLRDGGRVIGEILLKRGVGDDAEIGYAFARDQQGLGYASEAVSALIAEARPMLGVDRFAAEVDRRNEASLHLLKRQGFTIGPEQAEGDTVHLHLVMR